MKRTVRNNIYSPYSLHDMNVISMEADGDQLIFRTQSGMIKTDPPFCQPDGYVEFHGVQWDFCYVYILNFTGNVGTFSGEKLFLHEFLERYPERCFEVLDETYGYNSTKYSGYLKGKRTLCECMIEIYHEGDMVFVTEEEA